MRTGDIIRRAGGNLRQAKVRTILTSLAIAVGAFTIALAMAAGNGGRSYLGGIVDALGSARNINVYAKQEQMAVVDDGPRKIGEEKTAESNRAYRELSSDDIEALQAVEGVETVMPLFGVNAVSVSVEAGDEYEVAVQTQSDDGEIEISAGALGENYEIPAGGIVLPHTYVDAFDFDTAEGAIGETVRITFAGPGSVDGSGRLDFTKDFTVVAVDRDPSSPLVDYYNQFRISNADGREISRLQRQPGVEEGYYGAMVRAEEGADVDEIKQSILAAGEFSAQTFSEMRTSVSQMISIVQYGLMGFGALAIIASVFGIINTQYISVLERTQQIGLMKALGMRSSDVGRLFRYESAWIGFLGGAIGVGLAFLVTLLNPVITDLIGLEEGARLLQMDWLMNIALIAGLMFVAVLSGWFPSRKAAKLDPIEALRTE